MKYKRIMILAMLLACILAVGTVSAAENVTDDVSSIDESTEAINLENNELNNHDVLGSDDFQDNLSQNDNEDVLSLSQPSSSDYSVSVSDTVVRYGSSGTIKVNITPCTKSDYYKYDFYLRIYDMNGNQKYSNEYYGSTSKSSISYTFSAKTYASGAYTIKLINRADDVVMDAAILSVKPSSTSYNYPFDSDYSVDVSDMEINPGSSASISMSISPASRTSYKYYYYLKVYDSKGNEKISQLYYSTSSSYSKTYSISSSQLSTGRYKIKIINYYDGVVMDTANLTVKSSTYPSYSDYSVDVSDSIISYGSSGSISMSISPASRTSYKYYYYLRVYDSVGNQMISKFYSSTSSAYSKTYTVSSNQLTTGNYTIKIVNCHDGVVMDTANLTVKSSSPSYCDYQVSVFDTSIYYGSSGSISMSISPASDYTYKYDYYLRVYDSNNKEKISYRYYGTSSANSKAYAVGANQLGPGVYTINIINAQDHHVMSTASLSVKEITLETQNFVGKCDEIVEYKIRASENDVYKSGLKVTFNCNDEEYPVITDSNGYATLRIHLTTGTYPITTKCINVVKQNTITVNRVYVANKYTGAYVKSVTGYYGGKNIIKYGWKGNLEGYFRIYKGNKIIYQTKFNSNGYIDDYFKYTAYNKQHSLSKMGVGAYSAVISDKNGKAIAKGTIKIVKSPTKVKCSSFVMKVGTKRSVKVLVYDKSNSRKNVAGTLKLKINGKTYGAKVKKGVAVIKNLKFPSKVKTYVGTVKFLGNRNYKASSKNIKVAVRKLASEIDVSSLTVSNGAKASIVAKVYVIDLSGDYISPKSGTVKFTVAGGTYYAKVNNGVAKLRITAPYSTGTYGCKAVYLGSSSIAGSSSSFKMAVKKPSYSVVIGLNVNSGWYSQAKLKTGDVLLGVANSYDRQHLKGITIGTMIDAGQEFQHSTRLIKATVWYENDYTGDVITRTNPSVYKGYNIKVFSWIDGYTPYQAKIWYTYR